MSGGVSVELHGPDDEAAERVRLVGLLDLLICFASLPELEPLPPRRIPPATRPSSDLIAEAASLS